MLGRNILSRAILLRTLKNAANNRNQIRNGSHGVWSYRVPPPMPCKKTVYQAQILGGLCWWWILYHCATEPEHIYGEWPYVDPSTWTDEELGIPPDSVGPLKN
ncbi:NADH dehydrogenase [ubiquinone] 1 beta subcomplex subunit 2, mitochondrial-like [Pararge aegeria]|uniref:Jg23473 protein n=1 Tax=Pararge aegeria aegeria TaxID=348720 RepID=A0A8S4S4E5_9NEOP|nr:NADH dehydrogenase [ubiquinone] 1 beta subcomplex subunit 2, mitochondrial-like [Pararge aegeria]CAH2244167.1 jg23473 [Pararge aegeria aegeria]